MDQLLQEMREMRAKLSNKIYSQSKSINEDRNDIKANSNRINSIEEAVNKIPELMKRVESLEKQSYAQVAAKPPTMDPKTINRCLKD